MTRSTGALLSCVSLALSAWLTGCQCREGGSGFYPGLSCGGDDDDTRIPRPCTPKTRSCNGPIGDDDGCETSVDDNPWSCGGCDIVCPGGDEAVCDEGVCGVACAEGRTECDGACTDLLTDPLHCGQCEAACGTECREGVCLAAPLHTSNDPVFWLHCADERLLWMDYYHLRTASTVDFLPKVLVPVDGNGFHVAGDTLYMEDWDVLFSMPIAGGPKTEIDTGEFMGPEITASATDLYWLKNGQLHTRPLAGGPVELLLEPQLPPNMGIDALAVSSTSLYLGVVEYGVGGDNHFLRAPLSDPTALTPFGPSFGDAPLSILLHGDAALTVLEEPGARKLVRLDPDGGAPTVLVELGAEGWLHGLQGDLLLWSDRDHLLELDLSAAGAEPIERVHHPGGISDACVMGDRVYFVGDDRVFREVPRAAAP